jgi:hypothetical protein
VQTIAPKFTGRFNKGVDYLGDVAQFEKEFNDDLCVIKFAILKYGLPANLKLSVHSGSDKFSIYPAIRRAVKNHNAGLHLKTAGTTWLEEIIGLAEAGGGAGVGQEIYASALDILTTRAPYAGGDIDRPAAGGRAVSGWSSEQYECAAPPAVMQGIQPAPRRCCVVSRSRKQGERYLIWFAPTALSWRKTSRAICSTVIRPIFLGS